MRGIFAARDMDILFSTASWWSSWIDEDRTG
jgi:hypothetical protein